MKRNYQTPNIKFICLHHEMHILAGSPLTSKSVGGAPTNLSSGALEDAVGTTSETSNPFFNNTVRSREVDIWEDEE